MNPLSGKTALVTGAAGGIGAATAQLLAQRGAVVIATDLVTQRPSVLTEDSIDYMPLDVSRPEQWTSVMSTASHRHGAIHVLVNAAGIEGNVAQGSLEQTVLDDWHRVMRVNLDGTFLGCQAAMAAMKSHSGGAIINIASIAAYYPTLYSIAYGASKGAVTQLTKSVALTGSQGANKVRCNSVHPGVVATQMIVHIAEQLQQGTNKAATEAANHASRIPLGKPGQPRDVAALVAFLASDEAAYITGAEFTIDGGSRLLR